MILNKQGRSRINAQWTAFWLHTLLLGFYVVTCGFFLFPSNSGIQTGFYGLYALPALLLLCFKPLKIKLLPLLIFLSLPIYLTISAFWADPEVAARAKDPEFFIKMVLVLFLLYYGLNYLLVEKANFLKHWLIAIGWVGAVSAVINLANYCIVNWHSVVAGNPPRFEGLFWGGDTNRVAMFYTVSILANIFLLQSEHKLIRKLSSLSIIPSVLCILLAQSKVALAILILMIAVLLVRSMTRGHPWRAAIAVAGLGVICLWLIFGINTFSRVYSLQIRWEIWQAAVDQVGDNWLFGNGLNYRVDLTADGKVWGQAHNFVVDSYRFGGLIAVLLIATQIGFCCYCALTKSNVSAVNSFLATWLFSGVLASLVYSQQPFTRPSYTWFFYWIPMGLILSSCYIPTNIKIQASVNSRKASEAQRLSNDGNA